jgi:hypothetical protein
LKCDVRCDFDYLVVIDALLEVGQDSLLCFLLVPLIISPVISVVPLFNSLPNQAAAGFVRCVLCAVFGCLGALAAGFVRWRGFWRGERA